LVSETNGGFLVSQIKQIGGRIFEKILAQSNIDAFNGAQGRILYVLWQSDRVPIVELSKKTGLAKTTLTSMLDRMETSGLITRLYDKADRRQILVVLTEKANSLQTEYKKVSAKMNDVFYQGFSDDEIRQFENCLNRILNNLTEAIK
jgi:mobile rSAM pair MarR family regulator